MTLALGSATVKSATTDEGYHLGMGYSYLRALDLGPQPFSGRPYPNPAGSWAALPLLLERDPLAGVNGTEGDGPQGFWEYVFDRFDAFYHHPNILRYTFVGRFQIILLGVTLGALVFRWAKEWFGVGAGLLACFLFVFSPNILAHSRLITTDLASALGCLVTMYGMQRLLRRPSIMRAIQVGLVLGGTLLVKYSTLLLVPAIGILLLLAAWRRDWRWTMWEGVARRTALLRAAGLALLIYGLAGLMVWAGFGFEIGSPERLSLPFPVPAASYVDEIVYYSLEDRPAFLLGQQWVGGRWYFFPATVLFKTPPPMLFLFLASLATAVLRRRLDGQLPLWIFPAIYFFVSLTRGFNIGHRHLLPVLPFAFVFASQIVLDLYGRLRRRWARGGGLVLVGWYLGISLWIYPDYLAYFNLFAGGPSRGYQVLVDANLDWGQDLIQLRRYMERERVDEVWLSVFSDADPALYGVRYRALPNWVDKEIRPDFHYLHPDPGVYVISATLLQGMYLPNPSTFNWFLHQRPIDQIGHSMLVYRVEEDQVRPTWVGMCYTPEMLLSPGEIAAGFGESGLRVFFFECGTSGVVPHGSTPGWYVVPASIENANDFTRGWLKEAALEFEQRDHAGKPTFAVYRLDAMPMALSELRAPVRAVEGDSPAAAEANAIVRASLPLSLAGPAAFLGYDLDAETVVPGEVFRLRTFWRARRAVTETIPSIFVHLVNGSGDAWSIGDALDFAAIQWQEGDVFVQQHSLEILPEMPAGTYWIASGLYDLNTGARYRVLGTEAGADTLLLGPVVVKQGP